MKPELLGKITELRHTLWDCAELSGREIRTKAVLKAFLAAETSLELRDCGGGFCAAHRETGARETIVLRADYDALETPEGPRHLCGHDGHAAALCGAALMLEGRTAGKNVLLLFQPAEETGEGAALCCELFDREPVNAVYGAHNLPGLPFGEVFTRKGTFACGSEGVTLRFTGKPAHAAYPETGLSPAGAVGELLCALKDMAAPERYSGITMCTVIGVQMGSSAFGAAAADARVMLTLRGEKNADLEALRARVLGEAERLARRDGLGFGYSECDRFAATENDPVCAGRVMTALGGKLLPEPMRWSEDFGQYLLRVPGAFFGIGAGESCPALHTERYEYPDALLEVTADHWIRLIGM